MIRDRIIKVRNMMKKEHIDTFLVLVEENRRYLSGFTGEDTQFDESAGALLITSDALLLATDSRYLIQAQNEAPGFEIICYEKGLVKELPTLMKRLKTKRLGFEGQRMSVAIFWKMEKAFQTADVAIEPVDMSEAFSDLRLIKDAAEIKTIKKAVEIAETGFKAFTEKLFIGITEAAAAWGLEKDLRDAGGQSLSFPVIAAFGENSALPHAIPGERVLKKREPILFDWGVRYNGYCSDMTRTFTMGNMTKKFKKIFLIVYDAQKIAIDQIRPGVSTKKIDEAARGYISDKGFKNFFGHGLGHGVGIAVHEVPSLSPMAEKDKLIEENMIFTVEPGIYIPDWGGIRLENMVHVTGDGVDVLNKLDVAMNLS